MSEWRLAAPARVITDTAGRLWVADTGHHRILGVERDGTVHAQIGSDGGHTDGPLADARFTAPRGLALNAAGRALYVADAGNGAIRRIDLDAQRVDTIAGAGALGQAEPDRAEPATGRALPAPWDVALDEWGGLLYVAAPDAQQVWRLTLATGERAPIGERQLLRPSGLALSPDRRRLYVADAGGPALRAVDLRAGAIATLVGAAGNIGGCLGVAVTPAGIAITDTDGGAIRGVNPRHHTVATIWSSDRGLSLARPGGVAIDRTDGSYVVADTGHDRLVRVARHGLSAEPLALR